MSAVELGQIWTRKSPAGEPWDSVKIIGYFDQEPRGISEWVVQPLTALETISVTADDLQQVFTLAEDAPVMPAPELGVNSLQEWAGVS